MLLLLLSTTSPRFVNASTELSQPFLSMPKEYINYTITRVNGALWAKIDGNYPIYYSGREDTLPMVYPTPPDTTNISVWVNESELDWSNYTEVYPEALHHTGIGDWSMILAVLDSVPEYFVLRIHYEHPVQVINGSYMFLYDLNISPYLSASANKSIAYFTIRMETNFTDLNVQTVGLDETLKPISFMVTDGYPAEVTLTMVSEFSEPLVGDLLVSFKEAETDGSNLGWGSGLVIVAVGLAVAGVAGYFLLKRARPVKTRSS